MEGAAAVLEEEKMVLPPRLERGTLRLGGVRSIR